MKKYQIIYADPPWKFKYRHGDDDLSGHNEGNYKLMEVTEIKKLPIQELTAGDCALFMWVTDPLLIEGLEVMKAWGFEYKTIAFTWVKTNMNGSYWLGMGYYTRSNPEMCLLGVKGTMRRINTNVHQLVVSKRRAHSQKPDIVRQRVVKLYGDLPRIELFARHRFEGWDVWGDEAPGQTQALLSEEPSILSSLGAGGGHKIKW